MKWDLPPSSQIWHCCATFPPWETVVLLPHPAKGVFAFRYGKNSMKTSVSGVEKNLFLSKRKEECSFSKGKRKGRSFCDVTKGTKNTEKGRGIPLPFSNPTPLTNGAGQTFRYALNFQQLQNRWKAERYRLYKTRQMQFAETKKAFL